MQGIYFWQTACYSGMDVTGRDWRGWLQLWMCPPPHGHTHSLQLATPHMSTFAPPPPRSANLGESVQLLNLSVLLDPFAYLFIHSQLPTHSPFRFQAQVHILRKHCLLSNTVRIVLS